jgi:hypothetical protein
MSILPRQHTNTASGSSGRRRRNSGRNFKCRKSLLCELFDFFRLTRTAESVVSDVSHRKILSQDVAGCVRIQNIVGATHAPPFQGLCANANIFCFGLDDKSYASNFTNTCLSILSARSTSKSCTV